MIRFAPVVGLVLASPVVFDALTGQRTVDEALLALIVGVVAAAVGLHLLGVVTRPSPYRDTGRPDEASAASDGPAAPPP